MNDHAAATVQTRTTNSASSGGAPAPASPAVAARPAAPSEPPAQPAARKPRSDSVLAQLPPHVLEQLHDWLDANLGLDQIATRLREQHQVDTSLSSLSRYRTRRHLREQYAQAAVLADTLHSLYREGLLPDDRPIGYLLDQLQVLQELQALTKGETHTFIVLRRLRLAERKLEVQRHALALREQHGALPPLPKAGLAASTPPARPVAEPSDDTPAPLPAAPSPQAVRSASEPRPVPAPASQPSSPSSPCSATFTENPPAMPGSARVSHPAIRAAAANSSK